MQDKQHSDMSEFNMTPAMSGRNERNMLIIEAYNRLKDDESITNLPEAIAPELKVSAATVRRVLQANGLMLNRNKVELS